MARFRTGTQLLRYALVIAVMLSTLGFGNRVSAIENFQYVALGDSVASGHGLKPYGTAPKDKSCKRAGGTSQAANYAYPHYVRDYLTFAPAFLEPENFHMLACSGATVEKLDAQIEDAQQKYLGVPGSGNEKPGVVSITIGANNFAFDKKSTYEQAFDFRTYPDFVAFRQAQADNVRERLSAGLDKLIIDTDVERRILVTSYYNPFNVESVLYSANPAALCELNIFGRPPCHQIVTETVQMLNQAIYDAVVGHPDVYLVEGFVLDVLFLGHEGPSPFCGTAAPTFADSYIQALDSTTPMDGKHPPRDGNDCFHPNLRGHEVIGDEAKSALPYGS